MEEKNDNEQIPITCSFEINLEGYVSSTFPKDLLTKYHFNFVEEIIKRKGRAVDISKHEKSSKEEKSDEILSKT